MEINNLPHIENIELSRRDYDSFAPVIDPEERERLRDMNLQYCSCGPEAVEFTSADLKHYHGLQIDADYLSGGKNSGVVLKVDDKFRIIPWLEWKSGIRVRKSDRKIFKRLFVHRDRYRLDTPLKLSSYPIPGANFLDGLYCSKEKDSSLSQVVDFRNNLLKLVHDDGRIAVDSLAHMLQIRDKLEAIIDRYLIPLAEFEKGFHNILKVVIVETLRAQDYDEPERTSPGGSGLLPDGMFNDLQRVMSHIHFGHTCDFILPDSGDTALNRVLDQVKPVMLGVCARQGLHYFLTQRDDLLAEMLPYDRKRIVTEQMIAAAYTGRKIRQ